MNIRNIFPTILLLLAPCSALHVSAQEEEDYEDYIDETTLALPEGLQTQEIDSLLLDWQTRNFLAFDESCETTGLHKAVPAAVHNTTSPRLVKKGNTLFIEKSGKRFDLTGHRIK